MTSLRHIVYGFTASLASVVVFALSATVGFAAETPVVHFDEAMVVSGRTLTLSGNTQLGIFPNGLMGPGDVTWTERDQGPALPPSTVQQGKMYRMEIAGTFTTPRMPRAVAMALPYSDSSWAVQVWQYDQTTSTWKRLRTSLNQAAHLARAEPTTVNGWYVVLENKNVQEGIASYYGTYGRTTNLTYVAASNTYPKGQELRVTNLENGKSIDVTVVDTGAFRLPRVIDLSTPAFEKIQPRWKGLAKVRVQLITPGMKTVAAATSSGSTYDKTESIPGLSVTSDGVPAPSAIQAITYSVYDQTTGKVLANRQGDVPRPIASITKIMAAMVFLDTKTPLTNIVTYSSADNIGCSCLYVKPGETMTVRDVLYSSLVGSANNAVNTLVRSTGLTRSEFVARMNAKAAELDLTTAHFVDPTGLDPANIASANDVATMTAHALHTYEPIRFVTTRRSYSFSTINTQQPHTIQLRYSIYSRTLPFSNLTVTGGKTGYLHEALMTYALRVKNSQGAQVVVVVLGSPSYVQRLNDEIALIDWAFGHHVWK